MMAALCLIPGALVARETDEITALKAKIEPVMLRVDGQPDWLYSRLQMFWQTHATDVFVLGETFSRPGGERAPEPTVKYNGTRSHESQYDRPALEDVVPYDDDEQGCVTFVSKSTGKMEKTHPSKTGCNVAALNRQIMGIARDAARVYEATGEKRYGDMASKVFDVYMKGIYYRNVPVDLNHGHQQTLVGTTAPRSSTSASRTSRKPPRLCLRLLPRRADSAPTPLSHISPEWLSTKAPGRSSTPEAPMQSSAATGSRTCCPRPATQPSP